MSTDSTHETHRCPHCDAVMQRWRTPEDSTWGGAVKLVCFNDECPYFVRGWDRMMEKQAVCCSYRHLLDPDTGYTGPLPVWSKDAMKDSIVE